MCGIAGFWNLRSGRPAGIETIRSMTGVLVHRGPDEEGFHLDGALALGARRLIVTDPDGGRQPMANEDGTVQVVFNGAIYNHAELRRELEALGHRFRSRCDTEVLAHGWEAWGTGLPERLDGMFAFAVRDIRSGELLLVRDRLGIKPLYAWQGPEGVVFGSELKAIACAPWVPLVWDREAIDDFLTYEYVPTPRSIMDGVGKLPAGSWMLFRAAQPHRRVDPVRYWDLEASGDPGVGNPRDHAEGLRAALSRSVKARLMADVPLGAFLSGGIDSSIVVGLMAGVSPAPIRSFSMGFADRSYDELRWARLAASHFGTVHREERVTPEVLALAERLAESYDEPFGDVSAFPTQLLATLARQEVTVALSGDGGDELFAGYDHYRAHGWARRIRWFTRRRGWRVADALLAALPPRPAKKGLVNRAKRFAEGLHRPDDLEHARWLVFWDVLQRRELYTPAAREVVEGRDCFGFYRGLLQEGGARGFSGLQRQLYADLRGYLADDILAKVDRASMAVSLEVRVPFLDHAFVEAAMAVPAEWKLRGGTSKWILKEAFADLLPEPILRRGKEGFSMPMKHWLRRELEPLMRDLLSTERLADRGLFEPAEVHRLVEEHVAGRQNHAHRLWCLMALELSLRSLERRRGLVRR